MAYITQADLEDRFGSEELMQLTDRTGDVDTIDATVVAKAIADAGALIDSYLIGRYQDQMPFASAPSVLVDAACVIARFKLYTRGRPQEVKDDYDNALAFLKSISKGDASLDVATKAPVAGGLPQMQSDGRTFGRENSEDFI